MLTKKTLFLITALLYITYTIFPLFADVFHIPVWLPSIASFAFLLLLYPRAFLNRTVLWFLVYAIVLLFFFAIDKPISVGIGSVSGIKKVIIEFAFILPAVSIFSVLIYLNDQNLNSTLFRWSIILLFVSFILVVPLMIRYESIRAALKETDDVLSIPGLPNYTLMHSYTLFVPMMCYAIRINSGWKKLIALLLTVFLCIVVYDTFVTTSLLIIIGVLLFTLLYNVKHPIIVVAAVILLAIVLYILYQTGVFIRLIDWLLPAFEGTPVEYKLLDFRNSLLFGEVRGGSITTRMGLHLLSWDSFLQDPFIGTGIVGGHSSLLDRFGGMGLLGGLPFLLIFVSSIRILFRMYKTRQARAFFLIGVAVSFIYLFLKGLWGSENWLALLVLMPFGILCIESYSGQNDN